MGLTPASPYGEAMRRALLGLLAVTLVVAGCGDDDADTATGTSVVTETETETETEAADPSTTTAAPTPTELPGEAIDLFPHEGEELGVVGVGADDVLHVRAAPGAEHEVVARLDPLADGIVPTGHNRQLEDDTVWAEVTVDGTTGWASTAFLSHPGVTRDITSQLYPTPADRPRGDTMVQLGELVAERVAGDGRPPPEVVVVDGPTVGDVGQITVDVIGFPDDAQLGERLRIFAEADPGGESSTVRTVESMLLCRRGVSDDGLCR